LGGGADTIMLPARREEETLAINKTIILKTKKLLIMKKLSFLFISIFLILTSLHAQNITFTFNAKDASNTIDSIKATKVATGETAFVKGTNTINLSSFSTGITLTPTSFEEFNVYPNPFENKTTFQFYSSQNDNIEVFLINSFGQIVAHKSQTITQGIHKFNLSVKSKGMYIINVTGNQSRFSQKIISTKNNQTHNKIEYNGYFSKSKNEKSAKIDESELIHFIIYSGANITKIVDLPTESKTYEVDFFKCKDADGKNYKIVQIGKRWWMAENLAHLPSVSPSDSGSVMEPYYYVYNYQGESVSEAKATANYSTYGVLYNGPAAEAACPSGWHLPTDAEWKQLEMAIGMSQSEADDTGWRGTNAGTKLKATSGWYDNGNGTNDYGFSALPGGYRFNDGRFYDVGYNGGWDSATEYDSSYAWGRSLGYDHSHVARGYDYKESGYSVRCVRD